ncbi:MAG: hypothetical protein AAGF93_17275 [Cyanobacteria bacterium P01_H01_bin.105]
MRDLSCEAKVTCRRLSWSLGGYLENVHYGNAVGNGTPGFRSDQVIAWQPYIANSRLQTIWQEIIAIADA